MRIRITTQPPDAYTVHREPFTVGRIYNLDSSLASALIAEGCAQLDDALTADERRESDSVSRKTIWEAPDRRHAPQWRILNSKDDDPTEN